MLTSPADCMVYAIRTAMRFPSLPSAVKLNYLWGYFWTLIIAREICGYLTEL